jgi:hypothetical protein
VARFNNIKTSYADNLTRNREAAIPREAIARVNYIINSKKPKEENTFYIKASIISVRTENQITIEPLVKGSGQQIPEQDFLLNELTNIVVIPENDSLPMPSPGDEIVVNLVVSEITKNLNIDGYYRRILNKNDGPSTDSETDNPGNLKNRFNNPNSLGNSDFELPPIAPISPDQKDYNVQILSLTNQISGYTYKKSGSGIPFGKIVHKGRTILTQGQTVYCSGFTLYVCFTIATKAGLIEDKTYGQMYQFYKDWYGISGETNLLSGNALTRLGIGVNVSWEDAKAGDICQLWRGKNPNSLNGHSVIFLDWIYGDDGKKIGIQYRSSQTNSGVANNKEYLRGSPIQGRNAPINPSRLFFSRLTG